MEVNLEISPESVASSLPQVSGSCVENTKEPCEVQQLLSEPDIQIKLEPEDPPSDVDYTDTWISELSTLQYIKEEVEIEVPDYDEPNSSICTVSSSEHQLLEPDFASENLENLDVFQENHADDPYDMEIKQENIELGLESEPVGNQIFINKLKTEYKTDFKLNLKPQVQLERLSPETFNQHKDLYGSAWPYGTNITRKNKRLRCNGNYSTAKRECGKMKPKTYQSQAQNVCDKCNKKCKDRRELKRHVTMIHSVSKCFSCTICPFVTGKSQNFTLHLKRAHSGEVPFSCKRCRYRTRFQSLFTRHLTVHSVQKLHKCPQCYFKCNRKNNLIVHMKKHSNKTLKKSCSLSLTPFSCPHCYYKAESNSKLTKHLLMHSSANPYACNFCNVTFLQKCNLIAHVKSSHAGERISVDNEPSKIQEKEAQNRESSGNKMLVVSHGKKSHKCAKCDFASMWRHSLLRHVRLKHWIGTKPATLESLQQSVRSKLVKTQSKNALFGCNKCSYRAPNMHRLRHHLMAHSKEKLYKCPHCPFTTMRPGNLNHHIKSKHSGKEVEPVLFQNKISNELKIKDFKQPITIKSGAKPFACNQCSYRAALRHHLTRHLNNHTTVKRFKCSQCSYSSARHGLLKTHVRSVHSGEEVGENTFPHKGTKPSIAYKKLKSRPLTKFSKKTFFCNKCNYRAISESRLRQHSIIHTGLKPHKCPHCSYTSRWLHALKRHMKFKHSQSNDLPESITEQSLLQNHIEVKHRGKNKAKQRFKKSLVCNQCGITANSTAYLTRHLMIHTGEKPYKCDHCSFASGWKCDLTKHIKVKHRGKKIVPKLAEIIEQSNDLPESITEQSSDLPKSITEQSNDLVESNLVESCMMKLSKRKSFSCNKCSYSAKHKHHLKYHLMTHFNDRPFKCPYCPHASKWNHEIKKHVKIKHPKEVIGPKNVEGTEQTNDLHRSTLDQRPTIGKDTGEKDIKVSFPHSSYQTESLGSLRGPLHIYSGAEEDPFKCPKCPYASNRSQHLKVHIKNKHRKKKLVSNLVHIKRNLSNVKQSDLEGDQSFVPSTESSSSMSDTRIHESDGVGQSVIDPIALNCQDKMGKKLKIRPNKKSYNCPHCSYVCKLPQALQVHVRIQHSAVNIRRHVYSCTYVNCGYKTLQSSHFNTHLLCHTGIKPYKCELCDKSFSQKQNHQKHMKTVHSPEEEFACGLCLFKTFDFTQLKIHLTTHSEEEM